MMLTRHMIDQRGIVGDQVAKSSDWLRARVARGASKEFAPFGRWLNGERGRTALDGNGPSSGRERTAPSGPVPPGRWKERAGRSGERGARQLQTGKRT